tara:strand:+ start:324 stop:626 length:303 start_codon:yes stop_codon:yes gene_type:complete
MATHSLDDNDEANAQIARHNESTRHTFIDDIKWLMSSPRGRRLVWWLMSKSGVSRTSFSNSGSVMAFNEGQRNIGLMLQGESLEHSPDHYFTMLTEQRTK